MSGYICPVCRLLCSPLAAHRCTGPAPEGFNAASPMTAPDDLRALAARLAEAVLSPYDQPNGIHDLRRMASELLGRIAAADSLGRARQLYEEAPHV